MYTHTLDDINMCTICACSSRASVPHDDATPRCRRRRRRWRACSHFCSRKTRNRYIIVIFCFDICCGCWACIALCAHGATAARTERATAVALHAKQKHKYVVKLDVHQRNGSAQRHTHIAHSHARRRIPHGCVSVFVCECMGSVVWAIECSLNIVGLLHAMAARIFATSTTTVPHTHTDTPICI